MMYDVHKYALFVVYSMENSRLPKIKSNVYREYKVGTIESVKFSQMYICENVICCSDIYVVV